MNFGRSSVFMLNVDVILYMSCKWKQMKVHYSHYIKSPPLRLSFLSEKIFYISRHNWRAQSTYLVRLNSQNLKFTGQMSDDWR